MLEEINKYSFEITIVSFAIGIMDGFGFFDAGRLGGVMFIVACILFFNNNKKQIKLEENVISKIDDDVEEIIRMASEERKIIQDGKNY